MTPAKFWYIILLLKGTGMKPGKNNKNFKVAVLSITHLNTMEVHDKNGTSFHTCWKHLQRWIWATIPVQDLRGQLLYVFPPTFLNKNQLPPLRCCLWHYLPTLFASTWDEIKETGNPILVPHQFSLKIIWTCHYRTENLGYTGLRWKDVLE